MRQLNQNDTHIVVGDSTIIPSPVVRSLGVLFDSEVSMREHVARTARTCFFHLRRLRAVRCQLGGEVTAQLIAALVLTRIDAILAGLPAVTLRPFQKVINASVRVALDLKPRDHVSTEMLKELHWLPLQQRIQYKLCWLTYLSVNGRAPDYLCNLVHNVSDLPHGYSLRSTKHGDLSVPASRLRCGERAFSIAGPKAFNRLPAELKLTTDSDLFKRKLKTFLFKQAFEV